MKKLAVLLVVAVLAAPAMADYTFPLFNQVVDSTGISIDLNGASVPAGAYNAYDVTVDWGATINGNPWSNEAIWAFTDDANFGGTPTVFYADPGASPDSQSNGDPVTLTWSGFMDTPYMGGDPLWFNALQTFGGSDATWDNISITLLQETITPPASIYLGVAGNTGVEIDMNTFASDFDTELGLFNSGGDLLANNDDAGGTLQSQLLYTFGEVGTYYLALGRFNTIYGPGFCAIGGTTVGGNYDLVVGPLGAQGTYDGAPIWFSFDIVPEPASLVLLAFGGLALIRRR